MQALRALAAQRGHLFPFVPVCLAMGIGLYFALPQEPGLRAWAMAAAAMVLCAALARRGPEAAAPLMIAGALVAAGLLMAGARTYHVTAPVLKYRFYGAVTGRITDMDRSQSDANRLTLDQVWMEGMPPARTPHRIRIALHGPQIMRDPAPGQIVALTAHVSPPPAPAEPGGYDFRRQAWFDGLGGVGYTRSPVVTLAPPDRPGPAIAIQRLRLGLSAGIRNRIGGDEGAFAAAILTGDRAGISQAALQALRDSNIAHLLAISGLHMGLLTGLVFAALRLIMAALPRIALRLPTRKIAAAGALAAGAAYLALSGGNVATQRAFVMVAVMLIAVLLDRRALTLRAVALAAVIVLVLAPESLTEAGFQMSFAATTALVAAFAVLRDWPQDRWRPPRWMRPVLGVVISSVVAGAATAPIGAAHFNQVSQYGLLANLLTVPLMGALVMPAAIVTLALWPLGLGFVGLAVMRWGIMWILGVAHWVAGLDGATWGVIRPGPAVLPLIAAGMLWLMLWQGRVRWAGVLAVLTGLWLWSATTRPDLLIADTGGLIGVMTPQGRVPSKPAGDGFAAESWLENDGDPAPQAQAFARPGGGDTAWIGGKTYTILTGRGWQARLAAACAQGVVIVPRVLADAPQGCEVLDQRALSRSGALAVRDGPAGPQVTSVRDLAGRRPWTGFQ